MTVNNFHSGDDAIQENVREFWDADLEEEMLVAEAEDNEEPDIENADFGSDDEMERIHQKHFQRDFEQACRDSLPIATLQGYFLDGAICDQSALEAACEGGNQDTVQFVINNGQAWTIADWNTGFRGACIYGRLNIMQLMIQKGAADFNEALTDVCEINDGCNAEFDYWDHVIKFLIDCGATNVHEIHDLCVDRLLEIGVSPCLFPNRCVKH